MVKIQTIKVPGDASDHIKEIMDILGAKYHGSGVWGKVYKVDNEEVIKVFSDDRGYLHYLKGIAKLKQDNSFMPRINYIHKIVDEHKDVWYMVSMERLTDYTTLKARGRKDFHAFRDLVKEYVGDDWDVECLGLTDLPRELVEVALPDTLLAVMDVIKEGNYQHGLGFDLHTGNVMVRAGGDFVITDPLVY